MLASFQAKWPAPSIPFGLDFDESEALKRAGGPLPKDYLSFCRRYGSGKFQGESFGYLRALNPYDREFVRVRNFEMSQLDRYLSAGHADSDPEESWMNPVVPNYCYPTPGGLLTWGRASDVFLLDHRRTTGKLVNCRAGRGDY